VGAPARHRPLHGRRTLSLDDWTVEGILDLSTDRVIDPDVHRLPNGTWRMWYKEDVESHTVVADSDDLFEWSAESEPTMADPSHEAPIVFEWHDYFWLLADAWDGIAVWRSPDGDDWHGGHPDAFVVDGDAYVL
jgi:hypothetical protein